jgi:hypothetical protein
MALIASASSQVSRTPSDFAYMLKVVNDFNKGETGNMRYGARGNLRLQLAHLSENRLQPQAYAFELVLKLDQDWHINSRYPNDKDLIATAIKLNDSENWTLSRVEYPQAERVSLKFSEQPLSLYQGKVNIKFSIAPKHKTKLKFPVQIPVQIDYQSCNDSVCLAPESITFYPFIYHQQATGK